MPDFHADTNINEHRWWGEVQGGKDLREKLMNLRRVYGSAKSCQGVSFNCLNRMWAGDLIGPTGSPGIWELWRERGHVTFTHHQLSQILLAQLACSRVIPQFPKALSEISSQVGPSSKRTGDRFTGWSGPLGSDKCLKLRILHTPTHIISDEINLHHWIHPTHGISPFTV